MSPSVDIYNNIFRFGSGLKFQFPVGDPRGYYKICPVYSFMAVDFVILAGPFADMSDRDQLPSVGVTREHQIGFGCSFRFIVGGLVIKDYYIFVIGNIVNQLRYLLSL